MAYDHSFSTENLARQFLKSDFGSIPQVNRDIFRENTSKNAFEASNNNIQKINILNTAFVKNKTAYTIPNLEHKLIIRKLNQNLKKSFRIRQKNRQNIIKNLVNFLKEATPYSIYRLDIKSFYESINHEYLFEIINSNYFFCAHSKKILIEVFQQFKALNGTGVPRGLMISNVLSEVVMNSFDEAIKNHSGVFFYQRYVDDIIIITSSKEEKESFLSFISSQLPPGLKYNENAKFDHHIIPTFDSKNSQKHLGCFEYLGYKFEIISSKSKDEFRRIRVEIAKNKISKIKTKLIRAFLAFKKDQNFQLLRDRIHFLTTNFSIYDRKKSRKKIAGMYYSYPLLSPNSQSLLDLDNYLRLLVFSKSGFTHLNLSNLLSQSQKRTLLKISFPHGHESKKFNYFSGHKIKKLKECWKNV